MNQPPAPLTKEEAATIARHFLIAAIWADAEEGTRPRPTRAALATAEACAEQFVHSIGPYVFRRTLAAYEAEGLHPDCEGDPCAAFGHDLYLTLAGHGVGFWDRKALDIPTVDPEHGAGDPLTLGDWLSAMCRESPWRDPHGSGRLEFWRGWVHFRRH